jgi:hypothetical protein
MVSIYGVFTPLFAASKKDIFRLTLYENMKTTGSDPATVQVAPRATKFSLVAKYDPELVSQLAGYCEQIAAQAVSILPGYRTEVLKKYEAMDETMATEKRWGV